MTLRAPFIYPTVATGAKAKNVFTFLPSSGCRPNWIKPIIVPVQKRKIKTHGHGACTLFKVTEQRQSNFVDS